MQRRPNAAGLSPRAARVVTATPDRELIDDILAGDRKAIARFVDLHADAVYRFVFHRLDHREAVDDVVQDVFVAAWAALRDFRGDCELKTWLLSIARHKIGDYYRQKLQSLARENDADGESLEGTLAIDADLDERLDEARLEARTREILASLPEVHRAVLVWRYWDQCTLSEMAALSGRSVKAIERLLSRARQRFKLRWTHG